MSTERKEPTAEVIRRHLLGEDAPEPLVERALDALASLNPQVRAARVQMVLQANARQELMACEKPILYLQAAEDKFVSPAALEEIKRLKPSVKAAVVKGPHGLLQRNPREAIAAISSFLAELPPA